MCCSTHCASYCAPCQPLLRALSGWIRSPPPTWSLMDHTPFCTSVLVNVCRDAECRAFAVNDVRFRLGELLFSRLLKYCKGRKRLQTDTHGTDQNSKTLTGQGEIGQPLPQTLYNGRVPDSKSLTAIRKDSGPSCGSFLRKGEVLAYVGRSQILKDL